MTQFPIHGFYEHVLKAEWAALYTIMNRSPEAIAILGSGAMPETGVWVTNWAIKNGRRVRIHSLEVIPDRLEKSKKVYDILCGSEDCTFEVGDIKTAPQDLRAYDVVYFNAAVGATTREKEDILLSVVNRMRSGTYVLTRSTHSLKTMAYPVSETLIFCLVFYPHVSVSDTVTKPAEIQTPRMFKRLRPVLTTHLHGEVGRNCSASFIISRVV